MKRSEGELLEEDELRQAAAILEGDVEPMSNHVSVVIDGREHKVHKGLTIKETLEVNDYRISKYPEKGCLCTPCETGGCWSCAVEVDGKPQRACITPVRDGIKVNTNLPEDYRPRRIVSGFSGHPVGGVGTPWWLKSSQGYIEVACFASGCNFRCPQCQNWDITYRSEGKALTPQETAEFMTAARKRFAVDRMAISGGESTLNRRWLIEYVREVKRLNPDERARIHIDTNGSILTKDYIDELVEAGMTDVGPDLKGYSLETFMRITGVEDRGLAQRYHDTSWDAIEYLVDNYKESVFIGLGIPYNRELIPVEEIEIMGEKLYEIDPNVQVCVLDYRPEFRRRNLVKPSYAEMVEIHKILRAKGLTTVICQTKYGHVGPEL